MSTLSPILNEWGMAFLLYCSFVFCPFVVAFTCAIFLNFWSRLNLSTAKVSRSALFEYLHLEMMGAMPFNQKATRRVLLRLWNGSYYCSLTLVPVRMFPSSRRYRLQMMPNISLSFCWTLPFVNCTEDVLVRSECATRSLAPSFPLRACSRTPSLYKKRLLPG